MILGTLPAPTQNLIGSDIAALFYTNPANAQVQLNDTYYTFLVVKHGDCSVPGYFRVELGIGGRIANYSEHELTGHKQWNVTMKSEKCVGDHGIHIGKMSITFDNMTLNRISRELTEGSRTSISIRFIYRFYNEEHEQRAVSSSTAFICIKDRDPYNGDEEGGSGGEATGTQSDNSEGGNTITDSMQQPASSSHMISNVSDKLSNAANSSLRLSVLTEFLTFCSLMVLSFSV